MSSNLKAVLSFTPVLKSQVLNFFTLHSDVFEPTVDDSTPCRPVLAVISFNGKEPNSVILISMLYVAS